jgi:hypothetical protein
MITTKTPITLEKCTLERMGIDENNHQARAVDQYYCPKERDYSLMGSHTSPKNRKLGFNYR